MSDRYLMCAPDHFEVAYVINPWMEGNVSHGDNRVAMAQWQALAGLLGRVAEVETMRAGPGVPDMVFTANAGLVLEKRCIPARFRHAERQAEEPHFIAWFERQGFEIFLLPPDIPFEGAGDALLDRARPLLWLGYGHRSERACMPLLADWLDIEVQDLHLVDPRFYHLDTCFCPLQGGCLMYYPPAFDAPSQARIAARVPAAQRIAVDAADAMAFACNAVNSGRQVFLNAASPALCQELQGHGFEVHQTSLSEFMKAGGAAKCLTLKLNEARVPR